MAQQSLHSKEVSHYHYRYALHLANRRIKHILNINWKYLGSFKWGSAQAELETTPGSRKSKVWILASGWWLWCSSPAFVPKGKSGFRGEFLNVLPTPTLDRMSVHFRVLVTSLHYNSTILLIHWLEWGNCNAISSDRAWARTAWSRIEHTI